MRQRGTWISGGGRGKGEERLKGLKAEVKSQKGGGGGDGDWEDGGERSGIPLD